MKKHIKILVATIAIFSGMYLSAKKLATPKPTILGGFVSKPAASKKKMNTKIKELSRKIEKATGNIKQTLQKTRDELKKELRSLRAEAKRTKVVAKPSKPAKAPKRPGMQTKSQAKFRYQKKEMKKEGPDLGPSRLSRDTFYIFFLIHTGTDRFYQSYHRLAVPAQALPLARRKRDSSRPALFDVALQMHANQSARY